MIMVIFEMTHEILVKEYLTHAFFVFEDLTLAVLTLITIKNHCLNSFHFKSTQIPLLRINNITCFAGLTIRFTLTTNHYLTIASTQNNCFSRKRNDMFTQLTLSQPYKLLHHLSLLLYSYTIIF